jgi:hypothetical protein
MAVNSFIPEIWSAAILNRLDSVLIAKNLCNTDYQGDISGYGDTVRINEIGDISVSTYVKNSTAMTLQVLDDAQQTLVINQSRMFAFKVDDIDKAQTQPKLMQKAMDRAAYALAKDIDSYIFQTASSAMNFFQGANSTEIGSTATALSVTSTLSITAMAWIARMMDQENLPEQNRWFVAHPAIIHQLVLARLIDEHWNTPVIEEGANLVRRTNWAGINIYQSNNIYGAISSQWHCLAGYPGSMTLAMQLSNVEAYRDQNSFADVVRGLMVYGFKVVRPNALFRGVFTA